MRRESSRLINFIPTATLPSSMLIDARGSCFSWPRIYDPESCTSDIFFVFADRLTLSMYPSRFPLQDWQSVRVFYCCRGFTQWGFLFCRGIMRAG